MAFWVLVIAAGLWGCASQEPPPVSRMETVSLSIPFVETYADTEGAKRVVVTRLKDKRDQTAFVGEVKTPDGEVIRRYTMRESPTWVLPKILGGYLKRVGFNVSFVPALETYDGDVVRGALANAEADYLIAGQLERLEVRVLASSGRPVLALIGLRLDVYNQQGRLRTYYPAPLRNAGFLGDRADDPAAVGEFLAATLTELFDRAFDSSYFVETLDLKVETVREMLKANPLPPAPEPIPIEPEPMTEEPKTEEPKTEEPKTEPMTEPAPETPKVEEPKVEPVPEPPKVEPVPEPPKPKELTAEEKAELERQRRARELEEAVKEAEQNR